MFDTMYRIVISILVVAAHIVSFIQFQLLRSSQDIPEPWIIQFYILLTFSLVVTILLPVAKKQETRIALSALRTGVFILIGLGFGDHVGIETILLLAILADSALYLNFIANILFSSVLIILTILLQRPIIAWGKSMPSPDLIDIISVLSLAIFVTILSILLRLLSDGQVTYRELNKRLDEVTLKFVQTNMKLQDYAARAEEQGTISERKRLVRELHDTSAYIISNIVMMMERAIDLLDHRRVAQLREHIERVRDQAKDGLNEIRVALQALKPTEIHRDSGYNAVHKLAKAFEEATQIRVELYLTGNTWTLSKDAEFTIYRLVQEAMTNALRHGAASVIKIYFISDDNKLVIRVEDDGKGAKQIEEHYGLIGMRDRIRHLGGGLEVITQINHGFTLSAWIPKEGIGAYGQD